MKNTVLKLPEYYFIVMAVLSGYSTPFSIHPIFIGIILVFILQIIFSYRVSGLLLATLTLLINFFFIGALLSEFFEFTRFNTSAQKLLFIGFSIWILNMTASLTMMHRYLKTQNKPQLKFN